MSLISWPSFASSRPQKCAATRFHCHQAGRQLLEELPHIGPSELPAQDCSALGVSAMDLEHILQDNESDLSATARASLTVLTATLAQLDGQIGTLDAEIDRRARESEVARRLMGSARPALKSSTGGVSAGADRSELPGIGPLIATALAILAPPPELFRKGRTFAAA